MPEPSMLQNTAKGTATQPDDEILVKFPDGSFKILRGEQFVDASTQSQAGPVVKIQAPVTPPAARRPETPSGVIPAPSLPANQASAPAPVAPVKQPLFPKIPVPFKKDEILDQARQVIKDFNLQVAPELLSRAETIVVSYFKDIRDVGETTSALRKQTVHGGLGLSETEAIRFLKYINEHGPVKGASRTAGFITGPQKGAGQGGTAPPPKNLPFIPPLPKPVTPVKVLPVKPPQAVLPKPVLPPPPVAPPVAPPSPVAPIPTRGAMGKVPVLDIRPPTRLISQADELELSLPDFRRLAKTAEEATLKVLEKINLLSQQSFTQKIHGISAWRQSEVYRLYALILEESIAGTHSCQEVIAEQQKQGRATLTPEEFFAVVELNKQLRF